MLRVAAVATPEGSVLGLLAPAGGGRSTAVAELSASWVLLRDRRALAVTESHDVLPCGVAKAPLPPIPGDGSDAPAAAGSDHAPQSSTPASPPGPRPRPVREPAADADAGPPPASRLGGIVLIVAVIAVVAVVLFLVLRGREDEEPVASSSATPTATATPTPSAQPQVADQIRLRATGGGKAKGTMTVYLQGEQLQFALQGQNLPPSSQDSSYAVWLTGPGGKARRLGFTNPVGEDGKLGIQGPSEKDLAEFPKLYATYANVVVSQERSEDTQRPTNVVLTGKLPQGR